MKAVSMKNLERHKKLTLWLVKKFHISIDKAYDIALKIYK